ncbi:MAG: hypothetical protein ACT4PQ_14155 [Betaproteobacteria bacterium]
MLFAQAISAAQACIEAMQSATMAFADANSEADCHKSVNKNACLQQYTAGDQTSAQIQVAVAESPVLAVLTVPVATDASIVVTQATKCFSHSHGPPRTLRFCSFQL